MQISRTTVLTALCLTCLTAQLYAVPPSGAKTATKRVGSPAGKPVQSAFGESKIFRGSVSKEVKSGEKDLLQANYAKAEDTFRQALNKNSRDPNALNGMGFALALQFKLDGADQQFAKALALNAKDPLAHVGKAFTAINRLQSSSMTIIKNRQAILTSAEAECKTALRLEPDMPEANLVLGMVQKEQGKLDAAKESFNKSIAADPKYGGAFVNRGLIELTQGDATSAITDFKQAITIRSSNSTAHYGLGLAYTKLGQLDQALTELNTSLSLKRNSAPVHIALGDVYRAQGNNVAAIKEYQSAIAVKAESEAAYLKLADVYQGRGDLELAAADIRSGLELSPNNVEFRLRLADINLQLNKLDDALTGYASVLQRQPGSVAAANGMTRALVLKAQKEANGAYFLSNNFEAAESLLQHAIRMNPNNMQLRLADAKLRAMSGRPVDLSTVGNPTSDPERIAYAEAALAQCKFADAQQAMTTVIQNCQNAGDTFAVADIALMTRDLDSAEAAYKKAATYPGSDVQNRAKRGLDAVASSRTKSKQELTFAQDLARKKQFGSAIDRFRSAAYLNPRLADAHLGLADALQKFQKDRAPALREAAQHYRAYLALSGPDLPPKEQEKITKRADKCIETAYNIDHGRTPSKLSGIFGTVGAVGKKVGNTVGKAGNDIKNAF